MKITFDGTLAEIKAQITELFGSEQQPQVVVTQITEPEVSDGLAETSEAFDGLAETSETDKDGIVWDERIHSGSKKQTAKGLWARRKNITDELYDSVIAELKGETPVAPESVFQPVAPESVFQPVAPVAPVRDAGAISKDILEHIRYCVQDLKMDNVINVANDSARKVGFDSYTSVFAKDADPVKMEAFLREITGK